jgi:hypothetical protein
VCLYSLRCVCACVCAHVRVQNMSYVVSVGWSRSSSPTLRYASLRIAMNIFSRMMLLVMSHEAALRTQGGEKMSDI